MSDKALPPLSQVDPVKAWQPWEPTAADPWNLKWAGHLYRRAGFGGTPAELRVAITNGLPATLGRFLKPDPAELMAWENLVKSTGPGRAQSTFQLRAWWLYNILWSDFPLAEKMVLFWHNHFATSIAKVQQQLLMYKQHLVLRKHALGKFRNFLLDIGKDAAMLVWLDSNSNIKGKPNENYARELMELFSLGVGNYTEKDVREAARAFTGRSSDDEEPFDPELHDDGSKTVLGRTGNWNGDDIVRIVLEQPAAARFLVRKLYGFFISETAVPPDALLEALADSFRKSDYDIGALVGTMLRSRHFFSDYAYRQRIKSPVEFVVGAVRALWQPLQLETDDKAAVVPQMLITELEAMGQELFAPPNVKGWPGGKAWLNSATVLARHNFAQKVASGHLQPAVERNFNRFVIEAPDAEKRAPKEVEKPEPSRERDPFEIVNEKAFEPKRVVDLLVDVLLQDGIAKAAHDKLSAYMAEGKPMTAGKPADTAQKRRVRETVHAIMTLPEYQLA
jgi:uncharacterized protein (DUF1800 family)